MSRCRVCNTIIPIGRSKLGYDTCLEHGEVEARKVRHTVVPLHKSNYIVVSNKDDLKGINNKGGLIKN